MSLVDEMRGLVPSVKGVLRWSCSVRPNDAGGEGRLLAGLSWWMATGVAKDGVAAGRTRGYLAAAKGVERV